MTRKRKRGSADGAYVDEDPTERTVVDPGEFTDEYSTETLTQPDGFRDEVDSVLTDEDIDDMLPTVERDAPPASAGPGLPRFDMTGTITLPKRASEASPPESEPVTLRRNEPERPLPARLPPPRSVPPPKPARALPPPPRMPGRSEAEAAPTPIRRPSVPPPPRRSAPPPRMASSPPPARMAPSAPPPRMASAQPAPRRASSPPAPRVKPLPPAPTTRGPGDDTRPFPLQAPQQPQPSLPMPLVAKPARARRPQPAPAPAPAPTPAQAPAPSAPAPPRPQRPQQYLSLPAPPGVPYITREAPPLVQTHRRRRAMERNAYAAAVGVFGALALSSIIGAIVMLTWRSGSDEDKAAPARPARAIGTPAPTIPSPAPLPAAGTVAGAATGAARPCALFRAAERIAGPAMPDVLPMVAPAPGLDRVAVGYASGKNHADGIVVHLNDSSVEPRYSEELAASVERVTPLTDRAPVAFAVDGEVSQVRAVRTVPAHPPFRVGVSFFGFVRINQGLDPMVVWPGGRYDGIGEPVFVTTDRDGYGVTFRAGRGSGDVFAGWLTASGTADGDLVRIDAGPREVGPPAIASNDQSVVVVFSARGPGQPWKLRAASAPRGKVPRDSRDLDVSIPGAGDMVSPSIVALPNRGFVVQWLEGAQNSRRVVARTLSPKLEPVGLPIELSSRPGVQDTPGALVARDGHVLALHMVAADRQVDLWGAVLSCQ
jgi:hypothetical protein